MSRTLLTAGNTPVANSQLDRERAIVESQCAELVRSFTLLDREIKQCGTLRQIAVRTTDAMLHCSLLMEKLTLLQITLWNEL